MAKIAYLLLCHKDPQTVINQAQEITAAGDYVAIHFDKNASDTDFQTLKIALSPNPNVCFAKTRIKCGWGEWSLVKATLSVLKTAEATFPKASHFYMISGDCAAIKTAQYAHDFLDARDVDYIESVDFFDSDWIKTGMKEERLIYRHYVNERKHKGLFYALLNLQKKLGLTHKIPDDLQIMIGSQWWCLRRDTVEKILEFIQKRRDVTRFFARTWIPDETFFQTLVRHLVPGTEIVSRSLTFLMFTDYGMPVTFYNDHYDLLLRQDYLFARKISPHADELRQRLGALYSKRDETFHITNDGQRLFHFLTTRGRDGRRYAPRFWEAESNIGHGRDLYVIVCKKWHIAKRLTQRIADKTDIPTLSYLFSENDAGLPHLGGIETGLWKRTRHRKSLVRMLFNYYGRNRLLLCLDTSNIVFLQDFENDTARLHILEIECDLTDEYLTGHSERIGLASKDAGMKTLLPVLRQDILYEHRRIRDHGFTRLHQTAQSDTRPHQEDAVQKFLGIDPETASSILEDDGIFKD